MKKIKISEEQLKKVLDKIIEQETGEDEVLRVLDDAAMLSDEEVYNAEADIEDIEGELEQLLSPEEIIALQQEQIEQIQDRVQYMEELNADILEFIEYQMQDLEKSKELDLRKSKQKLRALETRAGREIFWLKSRRL